MKKKNLSWGIILAVSTALAALFCSPADVHAAGFSADMYINSMNKMSEKLNEQYKQQYQSIFDNLDKELEEIREEEAEEEKEAEQKKSEEKKTLEKELAEGLDYLGKKIVFDEDENRYLLQGYLLNQNTDYDISDLSDVKISVYDQDDELMFTVNMSDESMETFDVPADDKVRCNIYLPKNVEIDEDSLDDFSTSMSCDFDYKQVQTKETSKSNQKQSYNTNANTNYMYDYSASSQITEEKEVDCPVCVNGKIECKSCHGEGYLSFTKNSIDLGSGSTSYTQKTLCKTCGGSRKQTCLNCGGEGHL